MLLHVHCHCLVASCMHHPGQASCSTSFTAARFGPCLQARSASGCLLLAGNINQLILKMDTYAATLQRTEGRIVEFINPKYADDTKTAFKSSTRLECMMQDFPRELPDDAKVGFTVINQVRCCTVGTTCHYVLRVAGRLLCHEDRCMKSDTPGLNSVLWLVKLDPIGAL